MNQQVLQQLLSDIKRVRIAVVGDFCLDAYYFLNPAASEISIETGLPTQPVQSMRFDAGGAGTIVNNLVAIGVETIGLFGVVGNDMFGREMRRIFQESGVNMSGLKIQSSNWNTHVYSKLYKQEQELPRVDIGNFNRVNSELGQSLLTDLERRLPEIDVVIINQQVRNSIHTKAFTAGLADLIAQSADTIFIVDSRDFADRYSGAVRKLNECEAVKIVAQPRRQFDHPLPVDDVRDIAEKLYRRWGTPLFLTRGENGCVVFNEDGLRIIPGLEISGQTDPVGAGDSLLAGIAAALGAGREASAAAKFGNLVAGVTVQKQFQTGTATPDEVLSMNSKANYRYNPDVAAAPPNRFYKNSEVEVISSVPEKPNIKYAVFDHDGTISVLRQGWDNLMESVMARSIVGHPSKKANGGLPAGIEQTVRAHVDQTTGLPTIIQMEGLVELVRDFGLVPPAEILPAGEYKDIFNEELIAFVQKRANKISSGQMNAQDYTIKGAIEFLQALAAQGITLVLASGTDEEDVKQEAALMGYAHFFSGGIFGAGRSGLYNPKSAVLEQILASIGRENGGQIVSFGDGPAEMREIRKVGGLAVGVASDELRRHGLHSAKRSRLVRAGADLIIPDFSQMDTLLELLF